MLFIEPKDPVEFRRLLRSFRERRWQVFLQAIPRWLCALPLALLMMLLLLSTDGVGGVFCASTMAFFARDAGLVMFLSLSANRRRANGAAILYLLVLYALLPAIINSASGASVDGWLLPSLTKSLLPAIGPALLQAVLVWALVMNRWHRLGKSVDGALRPV